MVRVARAVELHDLHAGQGAARQVPRHLGHGGAPGHAQAGAVVDERVQQGGGGARNPAHAGNRRGVGAHVHQGHAHLIALTDAALKLAAGTEGII